MKKEKEKKNVIKPHLKIRVGHFERSEHGRPGFSGMVWCSIQTSWPKYCVFLSFLVLFSSDSKICGIFSFVSFVKILVWFIVPSKFTDFIIQKKWLFSYLQNFCYEGILGDFFCVDILCNFFRKILFGNIFFAK